MASNRVFCAVCLFTLTVVSPGAIALPFVNGDFSAGLFGWNTSGNVSVVAGEAQLDTGPGADPFSAVLVQGDDGSFTFSPPLTLSATDNFLIFDVIFSDLGADAAEIPGLFTDNLTVAVYDALDPLLDLIFGSVADITTGSEQIVLDVSSLAGRDVALSFELADENDGRDSRAAIDNIVFSETAPVPEPGSTLLLTSGLLLLFRRRLANVLQEI